MTGPEHYREAEALIQEASKDGKSQAGVTVLLARAQVHATLALTAATALVQDDIAYTEDPDYLAWVGVASIARPIRGTQ